MVSTVAAAVASAVAVPVAAAAAVPAPSASVVVVTCATAAAVPAMVVLLVLDMPRRLAPQIPCDEAATNVTAIPNARSRGRCREGTRSLSVNSAILSSLSADSKVRNGRDGPLMRRPVTTPASSVSAPARFAAFALTSPN